MLLCDIGNTSYHFLDGDNDYKESVKTFNPQRINDKVYYICVNPHAKKILESLDNWIDLSLHVDMSNYYDTMGIDRIVACESITDGVIVDAGSAITVDVVSDGVFQGGFIYPGTRAMEQTYKNISSALEYPFNYDLDLTKLPKNSQDAISYGYLKTLHSEVVSHAKNIYIIGGDAQKLIKLFSHVPERSDKYSWGAKIETNLIFDGMKKIIRQMV